ncbi:MAG: peptidoglycan editing factor PgeF, partial [Rhodospirillaceae bacterium]|nr:peptidoglycan editing factor PgeF [Rhodospirillaceae bacterium]
MNSNKPVSAITHQLLDGQLLEGGKITHGFFPRTGGVSDGIYSGLNCGPGSNDNPKSVKKNRQLAMDELGGGATLLTCYQMHSPDVVTISEPWADENPPKADAMVTTTPGLALGILTADCAPVLLADIDSGVIGALHAGWKGAVSGIIENTAHAMADMGANLSRTVSIIGPTIGQQSYEVGDDVRSAVIESNVADAERFFIPSNNDGHYMFDLPGYVLARLENTGIGTCISLGLDTYADEKNFFSYRRATHNNEKDYG